MNLLARKREGGWLLLAGLLLVWGCKEDLGIEIPANVQRTEIKVIELTLPVTNVYLDSIRTDKEGVLMAGEYSDPVYGNIRTKAFTEFSFKQGKIPTEDYIWINKGDFTDSLADLVFAGARLVLDVDRVISNDNFLNQNLELRALQDSIFSEGIYLSDHSINEGDIIGGGTISIDDLSSINFDSTAFVPVSVNFTPEYSEALWMDFEENTSYSKRTGFSISAITGNGMASFDVSSDTTEIQFLMTGNLYDTTGVAHIRKDTTIAVVYYRLAPSNHFTQVMHDRTGSLISSLSNGDDVELDADKAYFNELAGIYPKIDITPFIEFAETENEVIMNRATITIEVETNSSTIPYVQTTNYYFAKNDSPIEINWPGALQVPSYFKTLLQSDNEYLSPTGRPSNITQLLSTISESPLTKGFSGSPTIFWQFIYDNAIDDINGVSVAKRPTIRQLLAEVDNLVMVSQGRLTLGRNTIIKEGVKLKIYYTVPKD